MNYEYKHDGVITVRRLKVLTDEDVFEANKELAKFANKQVSDQLNFLFEYHNKKEDE